MAGFRSKDSTGPMYHPERDIAYLGAKLISAAVDRLEPLQQTAELREWLGHRAITGERLGDAVERLAEASQRFVSNDNPVGSLADALDEASFTDLPFEVRQVVYAAIGEGTLATWFTAIRDVSLQGEDSPGLRDLTELYLLAQRGACRLKGAPDPLPAHASDLLEARLSLKTAQAKVYKLETELLQRDYQRGEEQALSRAQENFIDDSLARIRELEQQSLWAYLRQRWRRPKTVPASPS